MSFLPAIWNAYREHRSGLSFIGRLFLERVDFDAQGFITFECDKWIDTMTAVDAAYCRQLLTISQLPRRTQTLPDFCL